MDIEDEMDREEENKLKHQKISTKHDASLILL